MRSWSERINFKNYFSEIVKFIIQCFFLLEMHGNSVLS